MHRSTYQQHNVDCEHQLWIIPQEKSNALLQLGIYTFQRFQELRRSCKHNGHPSIHSCTPSRRTSLTDCRGPNKTMAYANRRESSCGCHPAMLCHGIPSIRASSSRIAAVIIRQRDSIFDESASLPLVGINWATAFYKCHPRLKAVKARAIDWARSNHEVYDKLAAWYKLYGSIIQESYYPIQTFTTWTRQVYS